MVASINASNWSAVAFYAMAVATALAMVGMSYGGKQVDVLSSLGWVVTFISVGLLCQSIAQQQTDENTCSRNDDPGCPSSS